MAVISRLGVTFFCVWFIAVGGWGSTTTMVTADPPLPDCTKVLITLEGCLQFVTGKVTVPSSQCCSGATQIHLTDPACLCVLARNDSTTQIIPNYRLDLAAQLPALCKIQGASISNCPALLGETNATTPAAGPVASTKAPAIQPSTAGGAYRLTTAANMRAFIFAFVTILLASSALISFKY